MLEGIIAPIVHSVICDGLGRRLRGGAAGNRGFDLYIFVCVCVCVCLHMHFGFVCVCCICILFSVCCGMCEVHARECIDM